MAANHLDLLSNRPIVDLTPDEERQMIRDAQAGDHAAAEQLLVNYRPLLKSMVGTRLRAAQHTPQWRSTLHEDLVSVAVEAFYDTLAIHDADKHARIGGLLKITLPSALIEECASHMSIRIPATTRNVFRKIVLAAAEDYDKARDIAPSMGMKSDTFYAVSTAFLSSTIQSHMNEHELDDDDDRMSSDTDTFAPDHRVAIEDLADVARGLSALDPTERLVIEALYGVGDAEAISERDAAKALGLSRSTLQRVHQRSLSKMLSVLS